MIGFLVVVDDGDEIGLGLLALLDHHRTSVREAASGRERKEVGDEAFDGRKSSPLHLAGLVERRQTP
jgi:hypothetical protein